MPYGAFWKDCMEGEAWMEASGEAKGLLAISKWESAVKERSVWRRKREASEWCCCVGGRG